MEATCFCLSKEQLASLHEMLSRVNNWSILQNPQQKTPPQKRVLFVQRKLLLVLKKSERFNLKPFQIRRRKKRKQSRRWKKHNVSYAGSQLTSTLVKPNSGNEKTRLTFQMFRYVFVRMQYCVHVTDFCTTDSGQLFRQSLQTKEISTRARNF